MDVTGLADGFSEGRQEGLGVGVPLLGACVGCDEG
jgi:hypothetical protein